MRFFRQLLLMIKCRSYKRFENSQADDQPEKLFSQPKFKENAAEASTNNNFQ